VSEQLPLKLRWRSVGGLRSFVFAEDSLLSAVSVALALGHERGAHLISGGAGAGKTALLRALIEDAEVPATLLDAAMVAELGARLVSISANVALLAIDDVDQIGANPPAAEALFALLNARHDAKLATVMTRTRASSSALKDLDSRLNACTQHALKPLDAAAALALFRKRADESGIALSPAVLSFVETRVERDAASLLQLLADIDHDTLRAKAKLSVPRLKRLLADSGARAPGDIQERQAARPRVGRAV
jgi:DnaA-homolog protein